MVPIARRDCTGSYASELDWTEGQHKVRIRGIGIPNLAVDSISSLVVWSEKTRKNVSRQIILDAGLLPSQEARHFEVVGEKSETGMEALDFSPGSCVIPRIAVT